MSVIAQGQSLLKSAGTLRGKRDLLQEMFDWSFTCLRADVLSGIRRGVGVAYAQGINMHATACVRGADGVNIVLICWSGVPELRRHRTNLHGTRRQSRRLSFQLFILS